MKIGPNFANELKSAGLLGLPFSWGADGSFNFSESVTDEQREDIMDVVAMHDPTLPDLVLAASAALERTDGVALRCLKAGLVFPAEWANYVQQLRAIVQTAKGSLPPQPVFPVGT